jgi:hypothetical protein
VHTHTHTYAFIYINIYTRLRLFSLLFFRLVSFFFFYETSSVEKKTNKQKSPWQIDLLSGTSLLESTPHGWRRCILLTSPLPSPFIPSCRPISFYSCCCWWRWTSPWLVFFLFFFFDTSLHLSSRLRQGRRGEATRVIKKCTLTHPRTHVHSDKTCILTHRRIY